MNPEPRELEIDDVKDQERDSADEYWSGSDYLLSFIGAGIFALCLLIGMGECARRSEVGRAAVESAKRGAAVHGEPIVEINPTPHP